MMAQPPKIYPMHYAPTYRARNPRAFTIDRHLCVGHDLFTNACRHARSAGTFGIWRPSRRRALVEALNALLWPRCTLSRAKDSPWIHVQFSLRGDNLPILADLVMDGNLRALIDVLDRMDDFSHCPSGHWLSFRFPAHWAPSALGNARPMCPDCRNTGASDYSFLAMDPCPCANAVATMTGGDWPDAPLPQTFSPQSLAAQATPAGRTAPAPDKSGPGHPSEGNRA